MGGRTIPCLGEGCFCLVAGFCNAIPTPVPPSGYRPLNGDHGRQERPSWVRRLGPCDAADQPELRQSGARHRQLGCASHASSARAEGIPVLLGRFLLVFGPMSCSRPALHLASGRTVGGKALGDHTTALAARCDQRRLLRSRVHEQLMVRRGWLLHDPVAANVRPPGGLGWIDMAPRTE